MEEEKVRFSFWKKVDCSNGLLHAGEILDLESVLIGNRFFITGKSISGQIFELQEFQLGTYKHRLKNMRDTLSSRSTSNK